MRKVYQLLEEKKVLRAKELVKLGVNRMALSRMSEMGRIQKLGGGIYAINEISYEQAGVIAVSKYYPHAIISNNTALNLYGLGLERIRRIDVDIENTRSIRNELIESHRVASKYLAEIIEIEIHGFKVKIYSKLRCLYEAYKIYGEDEEFHRVIVRFVEKYKEEGDRVIVEKLDKLFKVNIASLLAQELSNDLY